jgi:hypothetical protein
LGEQTSNCPVRQSYFLFGHNAEQIPQKTPMNAARAQSGSWAPLRKPVYRSTPIAVEDAVTKKFFIVLILTIQ